MTEDSETHIFPFGTTDSADITPDIALMGNKGAGLIHMAGMGLSVPPGIIVSAKIGATIAAGADALPLDVRTQISNHLASIGATVSRSYGGSSAPLLLSVRSGAAVSMPGMMDTVLNLGMNDQTVEALATETGNARFAWDSYRRFIQGFSEVVLDVDADSFEIALEDIRETERVDTDSELSEEALRQVVSTFKDILEREAGSPFPQDVDEQLDLALLAVFNSWNTPRARRYRDMQGIDHDSGTAAIVQTMVFGNRGDDSCTGVYFTRNPSTGEAAPYGEYMPNAQGEDVVSGVRTPFDLTEAGRIRSVSDNPSLEKAMPEIYRALLDAGSDLERYFKDMQEVEFTVEAGQLYLLQTRSGKRTPKAQMRIAVEMAEQGAISKEEAVERAGGNALAERLVPVMVPEKDARMITKGLPASPGAAVGSIVFTSDEAVSEKEKGHAVILVRPETDPKDVHGMAAADGILTSRGGMTSHAAVVARSMGKPCITAAMTMKIDLANQIFSCAGSVFKAGEQITIDGATGQVFEGRQPITVPKPDGELATLLEWRNQI